MTPLLRLALAAASLATAACTPLQQAPLVYSSKVTVGLDVSANVAENQGASINIGVKTLDSAYVPVAVSKEIDKNTKADEKTIALQLIEARYGEGSHSDNNDPAGAAERNRKIDTYFAAKKAADVAASEHAKSESDLANRNGMISRLETLRSNIEGAQKLPENAAPATAPSQPQASTRGEALKSRALDLAKLVQESNIPIPPLAAQQDGQYNVEQVTVALGRQIDASKADRDKIQADLPRLKAAAQTAAADAERAKAEAVKVVGLSNTSKSDAMSVYGSFDSKASGDAEKGAHAGLLIGKVFSTGLASQNLTEAVKIGASSQCASTGFTLLQNTKDPAERQKILESLSAMCAPKTPSNGK